jgi:hypothetical protein
VEEKFDWSNVGGCASQGHLRRSGARPCIQPFWAPAHLFLLYVGLTNTSEVL